MKEGVYELIKWVHIISIVSLFMLSFVFLLFGSIALGILIFISFLVGVYTAEWVIINLLKVTY